MVHVAAVDGARGPGRHVLLPEWRGLGVGRTLWTTTEAFAHRAADEKLAIQVRASNIGAQRFYRTLGFKECGRLTCQVRIDGIADNDVLMELLLRTDFPLASRRP